MRARPDFQLTDKNLGEANVRYDLVEIAGRVQRLERDNRRLRLAAGCLVALVVAVPLVGAVLPQEVPEVIEARAFRVLDEQGASQTYLSGALAFYDDQGGVLRVLLGAGGLSFVDEQGTLRLQLTIDPAALRMYDEEGNVIWSAPEQVPEVTWKRIVAREFLVLDELGERRAYLGPGGLEFFDEQGTRRIALYADGQWAGQLAFLDEEGAVIEILPR